MALACEAERKGWPLWVGKPQAVGGRSLIFLKVMALGDEPLAHVRAEATPPVNTFLLKVSIPLHFKGVQVSRDVQRPP